MTVNVGQDDCMIVCEGGASLWAKQSSVRGAASCDRVLVGHGGGGVITCAATAGVRGGNRLGSKEMKMKHTGRIS